MDRKGWYKSLKLRRGKYTPCWMHPIPSRMSSFVLWVSLAIWENCVAPIVRVVQVLVCGMFMAAVTTYNSVVDLVCLLPFQPGQVKLSGELPLPHQAPLRANNIHASSTISLAADSTPFWLLTRTRISHLIAASIDLGIG